MAGSLERVPDQLGSAARFERDPWRLISLLREIAADAEHAESDGLHEKLDRLRDEALAPLVIVETVELVLVVAGVT